MAHDLLQGKVQRIMSEHPRLSVAVPLYNEQDVLPDFLSKLREVLDELPGGPHEIVLVNDGSADRTPALLEEAAELDPRVVVVHLSRNFGHQAAITAALDHVSGDAVVVMDGDLQDPPEVIPEFVDAFREGYDVVYARRVQRKEPLWLRVSYRGFYRLIARMSNVELPVDAGDFSLMSRRVVDLLREAPERHRYLRGLRAWTGFRQTGIPVPRSERRAGESKYSLGGLLGLAFDGIFAFSTVPIRIATWLGFAAIVLSSVFAVYSLVAKFLLDRSPQGFTALVFMITFVSGVHLVFFGVIGEYVGRVYEEVKRRPVYVVRRVVRRDEGLGN